MEQRSASDYCPKCQLVQPTFEFTEDSRTVRRCMMCGFPVASGLVLERAEALGLPSPPQVKILCVDDDPLILQLNGDILRFHGYTVLTALDGPTALELAARERPALLLLDIMMPEMDGFEVCRRLKADPALKAIPVIVLTAMTDPKLNVRAFDAGAELALRKPAEPAVVLRTIEAALALAAAKVDESPPDVIPEVLAAPAGPEPAEREPEAPTSYGEQGQPLALVCVDDPAEREQVVAALKAQGYAPRAPTSAADAIQRLRFMAYALVVLRDGYGSAGGDGNPVLDQLAEMGMATRRLMHVVFVSPGVRSHDIAAAFAKSVNLVLHVNDLPHLGEALKRSREETERAQRVLLESLRALGKA